MNEITETATHIHPPIKLLPDGWDRVHNGYYHKKRNYLIDELPVYEWKLVYNGYRVSLRSGITNESYHTVEKDSYDLFWTGVKLAHMPQYYIDSEVL